mmetsp:Transcript_44396/g.89119  ORF Transcript_44396/g.89119 Transcript_44396/m.89119 type:complete len:273 (+) Transcript_44396:160-978(+)
MGIINVWEENFEEIKSLIKDIIKTHTFVAMDTEFPGVVTNPIKDKKKFFDFPYENLKTNVDLLNIIQIGFSFSTEKGLVLQEIGCWQFNFNFNIEKELFAQDSIDLLLRSGVDFYSHEKRGLKISEFASFLCSSGLVLNKKIKWISFHSGYDFGYLIKILIHQNLPGSREDFFILLNQFFPCVFDIKYLSFFLLNFYGGLNKLAERLEISRIGRMHQAGSDSLLTLNVFFKIKKSFSNIDFEKKFGGVLYGLGPFSDETFSKIYSFLKKNER